MSAADRTVQVTLKLPEEVYERVAQSAAQEQRQVEELLAALVIEGLDTHATARELLERVSAEYRARLARENKSHLSSDEVLQELRELREHIARELYPG